MTDELEWQPPQPDVPVDLRAPITDARGIRSVLDIEYSKPQGYRPLRMDLMLPPGDGPFPVVVYIHGGAFALGSRRENVVATPIWRALWDAGIAVATVEYRLSGEARFPACLHDVKAAVRWLRRHGAALDLRPDAIGSWGESAGGHLSLFLGLGDGDPALDGTEGVVGESSAVRAAVGWYPVTDFLRMDEQAPSGAPMVHDDADSPESVLVGGPIQQHPEAARFASPISHVSAGAAPTLLVHGDDDVLVAASQSVTFGEALREAGGDATVDLVRRANHVMFEADRDALAARSAQFLVDHLR